MSRRSVIGAPIGVVAVATAAAVAYVRLGRPAGDDSPGSLREAARTTFKALTAGYMASPALERRTAEVLASFTAALGVARSIAYVRDQRRPLRPFSTRSSAVGVHHYLPGAGVGALSAIGALLSREEGRRRWFTVGFGGGVAVVLDEIALVVEDEDVYWNREWVPMAEALAALSGVLAYAARFLNRGLA
jgi:hypothetical protein